LVDLDWEPDELAALGNLIADAGFSDNGRADNGNKLLQAIGSIDNQNNVADGTRPGIERLLAGYIGNFATYPLPLQPSHSQFTWQERLFMIAEMNLDGSVDEDRMTDLQNAATKWLASRLSPMDDASAGNWFGDAGTLYGLTLLPPRKENWNNYDMKKAAADFFNNLIDYAPPFLSKPFHMLKDIPLTTLLSRSKSLVNPDPSPSDPQNTDWSDLVATSTMIPKLVYALAAVDPNFFPPSLQGRPLSDPQVRAYLNVVLDSVAAPENPVDGVPMTPVDGTVLTPEQLAAGRWVNAILRMKEEMAPYYSYPVEGRN
jgi:hypothetical protein